MTVRKTTRAGRPVLVVDIPYRTPDGRQLRYRRDAQIQTMIAAKAEERRLIGELQAKGEITVRALPSPEEAKPEVFTFGQAIDVFKDKKLPTVKHSTKLGYEAILKQHLEPRLGKRDITTIGKADLADLDTVLAIGKTSPSWRRNVHVVLRSVLKTAVVHGLLKAFPELPTLPKVGKVIVEPLTTDEVGRVLGRANKTARLAFALATFAGLRRCEIRGLRWPDVDLQRGVMTIRRGHVKGVEGSTKSGHDRSIPIIPPLRVLLEAAPRTNWGPVAPSQKGKIWGEASLLKNFQRTCTRAGIGHRRFHALRHYFVSELFRRGGNARAIQELAGHLHLSTTQKYAFVFEQDRVDTIARLA